MKTIERDNIGPRTTANPYGHWVWLMDGKHTPDVPVVTGESVVISMGVGHALTLEDGLAKLRELLKAEPLRPDYNGYNADPIKFANELIWPQYPGIVSFHGNFDNYSFGFRFDTNDAALIAEFQGLIDANRASEAYAESVKEWAAHKEQQAEEQRIRDEKRDAERQRRILAVLG